MKAIAGDRRFDDPRYAACAPTQGQAKAIFWNDLLAMLPPQFIKKVNKSDSSIFLINGSEIVIAGLDNPARIEGRGFNDFLFDEVDDIKEDAWEEHIYPCFVDRGAGAMFTGVPNGLAKLYELSKLALTDDEYDFFTWKSAEVLSPKEIAKFKSRMDDRTFAQEFEASFMSFSGKVAYNFSRKNYEHELYHDLHKPLLIGFDFNNAPGVAAIAQEQLMPGQFEEKTIGNESVKVPVSGLGFIGEVWIPRHSNTLLVCQKLYEDWQHHQGEIIFYGDASGGNKTAQGIGGSDWDLIKNFFKQTKWANRIKYEVPRANPKIKARINATTCLIKSTSGIIRLMMDAVAVPYIIEDFERLTVIEGTAGEIDKKSNKNIGHIFDAATYIIAERYPVDEADKVTSQEW
jgi:hypothetical protein